MRFSGFDDEWNQYYLKDVIQDFINGQTPSRNVDSFWNGDVNWVSSGELNYNYITSTIEQITAEGKNNANLKLLSPGTFLIAITGLEAPGTRGSCAILGIEATTNQSCMALLPKEDKIITKFLYYWYLKVGETYGIKYTQGTKQQSYNKELLEKLPITIPDIREQNKISEFLSVLNHKIELLEQKYHYYQEFKKYLMQQIFTQKLRFNFTDEWEKYLLGDISLIGKGFTPSTSNPSFWDGDLKWLSIADMNQGKYINQTTKKITSDGSKNKEPVKKSTLLMSFKLSIGKLGILTEDMYTNEAICNFKWKNKDVLTEYMYYYLSSINILKYGSQAAKGITLNNETLSTIPVLLPSLEEQKKIINILSDVDMKINMLENSINDTSKFKKGLLQQMFVVRINWRCNFKLAKSPSFNKHLLILKNKIIFIIIK